MFDSVSDAIRDARKIVFVTGAGISQESGIPTFRGKEGLWRKYDPMQLATIEAFYENPRLVWEWYQDRRGNILGASPNAGHLAIAGLEKYKDVVVLTQNIDGLHQKAGSSSVFELHGSIIRIKCTSCAFSDNTTADFDVLPPLCKCGEMLRPDVVWFGEPLPQYAWSSAIMHAQSCDVMVIAGTSLEVSPANLLPLYAKQNGAVLVEVNPEKTAMSDEMDISLRQTSSLALPHLLTLLKD